MMLVNQFEWTLMKWVCYPIERVTLRLQVTRRRKVTCSIAKSNSFHFIRNLVGYLFAKLIMMLVNQFEWTLMKWVCYPIERGTLRLKVTHRRRRKVTRSM